MEKKYKLTNETININGTTLYRIEALKKFFGNYILLDPKYWVVNTKVQ